MCFEGKERVVLLHEVHGDAVGGDPAFAERRVPVDHIKTMRTTGLYFRGRGRTLAEHWQSKTFARLRSPLPNRKN
jgi:hypothetical protein